MSIKYNSTPSQFEPGGSGTFSGGAITGATDVQAAGASDVPGLKVTGLPYTAGSSTTNKPQFLVEPSGTTSTAWSTSGTMLGVNAATGFVGILAEFQLAGVSKAYITYSGTISGNALQSGQLFPASNNTTLQVGLTRSYSNAGTTAVALANNTHTQSSGSNIAVSILPTYNQTSTAAATDLLINRTQTAVGSGAQNLIDAQVGGSSKFRVTNTGLVIPAVSLPEQSFISNGHFEVDTTGWATYADAAGATPVNGTGGAATLTLTRTTSSPLRGVGSGLFTKDAVNRQGEGGSYDFSVDASDKGRILEVSFDYSVVSGTYATGDLALFVYDVTNSALITSTPYNIETQTTGTVHHVKYLFTAASTSTSYRLIFHVASTSASAYTVSIDRVRVISDVLSSAGWKSYTPTIASCGTVTSVDFKTKLVDGLLHIRGCWTSGVVAGTAVSISLPGSATLNTADMLADKFNIFGTLHRCYAGATGYASATVGPWAICDNQATSTVLVYVSLAHAAQAGPLALAGGSLINANSDTNIVNFAIPFTGGLLV
jgi:hypothetical protein